MKIKVDNRDIQIEYRSVIAVQYDNDTEVLDFEFDKTLISEDLSGLMALVLYQNSNGTFLDQVGKLDSTGYINVLWDMGSHITSTSGDIEFAIIFASCTDYHDYLNSERIWSTKKASCFIDPTLLVGGEIPEPPLIGKLIAISTALETTVDEAIALVESGTLKGEKGDQGIQGPPGADGAQGVQGIQGEVGPAGTGIETEDQRLLTTSKIYYGAVNELFNAYNSDLTGFLTIMNGGV